MSLYKDKLFKRDYIIQKKDYIGKKLQKKELHGKRLHRE